MTIKTTFNKKLLLNWILCFTIATVGTLIMYTPDMPARNFYWFGTVMAVSMFAFEVIPNFATALALIIFYICTGVADPELATAGWTTPIPWLCLCGMLIGILMEKTHLSLRIALYTISKIGTTPVRLYIAFYLAGAILGLLIPDLITIVIIFMAIASGICSSLKLTPMSKTASAIILAAYIGATMGCSGYLPTNTGIVGLIMVKDMGVPFSWVSFLIENFPFYFLQAILAFTILHLFIGKELAGQIAQARETAASELDKLGKISRDEYKTLGLAILAVLAFSIEPFGIPGYWAFCAVVVLGFTPLFNLLETKDISEISFPILFFIAGCMAIGIVAGPLGIPQWLVGKLVPLLSSVESSSLIHMMAYWVGVLVNMLLTPMAACTGLSVPIAETALQLGMSMKPLLYSFLYGLDQFFLPYELAPAMIMFATGFVRIRYIVLIMGLRIILTTFIVGFIAAFYWPLLSL